MASLTSPTPAVKGKPGSSKPVSRHFRWLYRHSGDCLKGAIRVALPYANRSEVYRYWVEAIPSDFGAAFRLTKITPEGKDADVYSVCVESAEGGHCDCLGQQRWGHCKHLDLASAIASREQLS